MSVTEPSLWTEGNPPRLQASRDLASGEIVFPAVPAGSPLAARHATVSIEPVGEVYSFTIIHPGPKSGLAPYALGYVDLPGPVRLFGRLQGKARPEMGDRYECRPDSGFGYAFHHVGQGVQR
jgi:hypothetical protein